MELRMMEFKQGTNIPEHGTQFSSFKLSPPDGFEPQADEVLRPSLLHLAERIIKRLIKLRKLARYSSCLGLDLSRAVRDDGAVPSLSYSLDSSYEIEQRGYDSDEQSTSAGFACGDTPTSSSSFSRGSSSFESLAAVASSYHGTPVAANANSHTPGSQMMANMLLSLLTEEARRSFTLEEDDDEECSTSEHEHHQFRGPRACAWHQAEDEILTELEWRTVRCNGHLQDGKPTAAACQTSWKLQAGDAPTWKVRTLGSQNARQRSTSR